MKCSTSERVLKVFILQPTEDYFSTPILYISDFFHAHKEMFLTQIAMKRSEVKKSPFDDYNMN